jgi:hypothetical protein
MAKRKTLWIVGTVIVLLVVLGPGWNALAQRRNFTEFVPSKLPAGVHIASSTYQIMSMRLYPPSYRTQLNLNLSLSASWISETKATAQDRNYGYQSHSPGGTAYDLRITPDPGDKQIVYELRFIKGGTVFFIPLRDSKGLLTHENWGAFIDSFQPATVTPTSTSHSSYGEA